MLLKNQIKINSTNFPFFIAIHNAFVFVDSNSSTSVTVQI